MTSNSQTLVPVNAGCMVAHLAGQLGCENRQFAPRPLKCKVAWFSENCDLKWLEGVLAALRSDANVLLRIVECRVALIGSERQIAVLRREVSGAGGCR